MLGNLCSSRKRRWDSDQAIFALVATISSGRLPLSSDLSLPLASFKSFSAVAGPFVGILETFAESKFCSNKAFRLRRGPFQNALIR